MWKLRCLGLVSLRSRFSLEIPAIIAEGDGMDWVELELIYESLREHGNYELVIVRSCEPTVTRFERLSV